MFDQILDLVKEHLNNDQQVAQQIPADKTNEVHREVAAHVDSGIKEQAAKSGIGGLLSSLAGQLSSGNTVTNAIQGGLVATLGSKLGLPPAATGAIAAALPGILSKFANKANDPNDHSITHEGISKSISASGLGNIFG
jgi:hypothetical protein